MAAGDAVARDRRVADDQPVEPGIERHGGDILGVALTQVGRDLHRDRHAPGAALDERRARGVQRADQALQIGARLQVTQARRVGRGDVDRDVVDPVAHRLETGDVIGDRVGAVAVGADIDADDAGARPAQS